jgi:hypothetical protein
MDIKDSTLENTFPGTSTQKQESRFYPPRNVPLRYQSPIADRYLSPHYISAEPKRDHVELENEAIVLVRLRPGIGHSTEVPVKGLDGLVFRRPIEDDCISLLWVECFPQKYTGAEYKLTSYKINIPTPRPSQKSI